MSFFGVTYETISKVWAHPNADRLELASLHGLAFQFVVPKGVYKEGDGVFYFPIDAVLPPELIEKLGLTGKLAGKDKNRIKTIRLRNAVSQGVVSKPDIIDYLIDDLALGGEHPLMPDGRTLTEYLGVTKYEAPAVLGKDADLLPLPAGLSAYDIEGADRYGHILELMMDEPILVTEKVEGSNFSVTHTTGGLTFVNQRNFTIKLKDGKPPESHTWWKVAIDSGLAEVAKELSESTKQDVTIYGEMIGPKIQGNYYGVNRHKAMVFDIKVGGNYLPVPHFDLVMYKHLIESVPVLSTDKMTLREFLGGKTVQQASSGKSLLADKLREGIVIKPMKERYIEGFGRLIIKQRDPIYLGETEN